MSQKPQLPLYAEDRLDRLRSRLKRIEGQSRGIARMLEEQRPCPEVLQQLASVQSALRGVTKEVLRNYLENCATEAIRSGDNEIYDQLMDAIYKFAK
ncbi:metal-sensitive transcriptional regulator [Alienimonas californiensis]|nr:metal-sensitive transcriptional regulator [Alienimonas californiensis]